MLKVDTITKDWKEAGSFPAQINLYGFWDEHCFLTKTGDLGAVLKIGGIDYESLDHAGRDYAVKRLEAALRSLDDRTRLYQILFKRNHPVIPHAEYQNPLVRSAVEQRAAFLQSRSDRLYSIEIFWVVMIDGSYRKTGLLHALAQLPKTPGASLRYLRSLFSGNKTRTLRAGRARPAAPATKGKQFEWAAKRPHEGRAVRGGRDIPARPASRKLPPLQDQRRASLRHTPPRLAGVRFGAGGASQLSADG